MSKVDPVSIEVVGNYLVSAVREMNSTLRRTAYSTILRESMDSSTALFDPLGQMIGQADHVPSHQGSLAKAARMIAEEIPLDPEDIVILNHPYEGGTHHPDIMIFKPVSTTGAWSQSPRPSATTSMSAAARPARSPPTPGTSSRRG